jgi:hypothetical protein
MALIFALIPLTLLAVIGFFVLLASSKTEGVMRTFGKSLSIWIFVLVATFVAGIATAPLFGGRPFGMPMMRHGEGPGMMGGMMHRRFEQLPETTPPASSPSSPESGSSTPR